MSTLSYTIPEFKNLKQVTKRNGQLEDFDPIHLENKVNSLSYGLNQEFISVCLIYYIKCHKYFKNFNFKKSDLSKKVYFFFKIFP